MEPVILPPNAFSAILETRYLSVAGLVVLLWDHILTFEQERSLIWPSRSSYVKWAFLCTRYLVPIILIINSHTMSGISGSNLSIDLYETANICKPWFALTFVLGMISLSVGNSLIIIKIWKLWDGKKDVISGTIVVFGLTVCGLVAFIGLLVAESLPNVLYDPMEKMCALAQKPRWLKGVWALSSGFDAFVFAMVCLNALSRPRESRTFLVNVLYRDGMFFFLMISALGWLNLVLAIAAPVFQITLGVFCIWALSVTLVSRMIINLRAAEIKMHGRDSWVDFQVHQTSHEDSFLELQPRDKLKSITDV